MSGLAKIARIFCSKNNYVSLFSLIFSLSFITNVSASSIETYEDFNAASEISALPKPKSMIIQDLSGSMYGKLNDGVKFQIAQNALRNAVTSLNGEVDLGLIAYGHRVKGSCTDIEVISEIRSGNANRLMSFVERATPKGRTPLAASLRKAGQILSRNGTPNQSIILFTDGIESCNGDPCAEAQALVDLGIDIKAHVIGFDLNEEQQNQLRCVAEVTGGEFIVAGNEGELAAAFTQATDLAKKSILEKENALLRAAIEKLKRDLSSLKSANLTSDADNLDLKRAVGDATKRIQDLEGVLNGKNRALEDALARIAELEEALRLMTEAKNAAEAKFVAASGELEKLRAEMAELKSKLGATEDMLMSSRAAVKAWNKKAVKLEADVNSAKSDNTMLYDRNAELNSALDLANAKITDRDRIIADNKLANSNQQRDIDGLLGDKGRLTTDVSKMRAANGELNDKLRVALRKLEIQSNDIADLEFDRDRLNKDVADLAGANKDLKKRYVDLSSVNSKLGNDFELKDAQHIAAKDKIDDLRRQLSDQNQQNAKLNLDNGELLERLQEKATDLQLKDGEVSSLSNQVVVLSTGLQQAISLSQQLESLLRSKQASMEKSAARYAPAATESKL